MRYSPCLSLPSLSQLHLLEYNDDTGVLDKMAFHHPAGEQRGGVVGSRVVWVLAGEQKVVWVLEGEQRVTEGGVGGSR